MDKLHLWGGAPSRPAQQLRRNVRRMLSEGWSPAAIRHEILTSPCTRKEQNKLQAPAGAVYGGECAVKVIEDVQDKYGNYCIIFKSTNLRLIYDWLHTHYSGNGFKFAIVIDLSIDYDYEEPTETLVYFLDEITEEVLDYAGLKLANEDKA